ncbi:hypothetical protein [uncultured Kiloniella sp.]|uniref:hypothetical protein n=1 Tax=uncultured Kiloniella sp. TaxID=1133091 RepID=UPI00262743C5|nr:hypothetical protein [uncultured Kiloniella sp.]
MSKDAKEARLISRQKLSGEEKKQALDLVEEEQNNRQTQGLSVKDIPKLLLLYQSRWLEDQSDIRIGEKSRRIGFSWGALAAEGVLEASCSKSAGGMDQFYMGYNMRMAAGYIGDCAFFAKAYGHAVSEIDVWKETILIENEKQDIVTYKITFASGFIIEALSSNPHNWRSRQGHARIDEAAFHQNLKEVIKGALAFKMWGGRIDIVSTHNGEDNEFNELVKEVKSGKLPWSHHKITFDDALKQGFYKRVCLIRGKKWSPEAEEKYRKSIYEDYPTQEDAGEELDCIPKKGSGAYFTRMLIEKCQKEGIPIIRHQRAPEFVLDTDRERKTKEWIKDNLKPVIDNLPTDQRSVFGFDFGRDGDLSVLWALQEASPLVWETAFILEMRKIPFDAQWIITDFTIDELPLFTHCKFDARGNGQSHAEKALQKKGESYVDCVMLSAPWYREWFPKYRAAFEGSNIIVPKSEDIIADHRLVQLVKGNPGMSDSRTKGSDGQYRHGDSAVAGVLAWAAATEENNPPPAGTSIHEQHTDTYAPQISMGDITEDIYDARSRYSQGLFD